VDSPTANEVRRGILKAFEDNGLREGESVQVRIRIAAGDLVEVQNIARSYVDEKVDLIMPLTTQCLQAALITDRTIPIVFGAVAAPYLVGAGRSATDHLPFVTGVVSTGPVRQTVKFIRDVLPKAKRLGTLWTRSEVNSEYYLEIAKEAAAEYGFDLAAVPIANATEIPQAVQILVNRRIDALFPMSDNTLNSSFQAVGRAAAENRLPLFGGFLRSVEFGACAALGYDFFELGYKTGQIAVRVKNGESPAKIPIQAMEDAKIHLSLDAAELQGATFPKDVLDRAAKILRGPELGPQVPGKSPDESPN
jgi:putative tryptophan/tyrosine transport system substrate-binding protein